MAKSKTAFFCTSCGYETGKWLGKCPSCSEWNTIKEISLKTSSRTATSKKSFTLELPKVEKISEIVAHESNRIYTSVSEWDRVLNGSVPGQAILLSGEPGIGKSTLLLQIANQLAQSGSVIYVNGEESSSQVKLRADRLSIDSDALSLYSETNTESIIAMLDEESPTFLIVDSLQTLESSHIESAPGSLGQLRECTHQIVNYCKQNNIITILVSHVTKDGSIAGPKAVEHLVDTVLFLESDTRGIYRVLRCFKNRFGTTDEAGFFEMRGKGLVPTEDLSEAFLSIHEVPVYGSTLYAHSEGQRIFPIEIQVLCHHTNQNYPRRTAEGIDNNRLSLLTAVVEKQLKLPLNKYDIYANITGGLDIKDRALDMALVIALCSSFKEKALDNQSVFIGELGLTGELRPVRDIEKRVRELFRLGIKNIYVPYSKQSLKELKEFSVKPIRHINELFVLLFGK